MKGTAGPTAVPSRACSWYAPGAGVTRHEGTVTVVSDDVQRDLGTLLAWAAEHALRLDRLEARAASLESVFLDIAADRTDRTDRTTTDPHPATEETR